MLAGALQHHAEVRPGALALVTPEGQEVGFGRLNANVLAFAARLLRAGVAPGDTVLAETDNPAVRLALWVAAWRIGAQPVAVPGAVLARAGHAADWAVVQPDRTGPARRSLVFGADWSPDATPAVPLPPLPEVEPGCLVSSSGSTGAPKLIPYPPGTALARNQAMDAAAGAPRGRVAVLINMNSGAGLRRAYRPLMVGQAVVLPAGTPAATLERMVATGTTELCGTPLHLARFCDAVEAGAPCARLDRIETSGAACPPALIERVTRVFGCPVTVIYGTAEMGTVARGRPFEHGNPPGLVGPPAAGVEVRFQGPEGRLAVRVPVAQRAGPYLNAPGPFDADGWLLTGDCGHLTAAGHLVIAGRADQAIRTGPVTVLPETVEALAMAQPGIRAAAAFGLPRTDGYEDPWLALVMTDEARPRALARALAEGVPGLPDVEVMRLSALPQTLTGKTDRATLRAWAAAGRPGEGGVLPNGA